MRGGVPDSAQWVDARIAAFATRSLSTSCPPSSGFVSPADAAAGERGYALTLTPSVPTGIGRALPFVSFGVDATVSTRPAGNGISDIDAATQSASRPAGQFSRSADRISLIRASRTQTRVSHFITSMPAEPKSLMKRFLDSCRESTSCCAERPLAKSRFPVTHEFDIAIQRW